MTPTDLLVDFLANLTWNDLPNSVREKSKTCLLDTLGVAIAGSDSQVGEIVSDFVIRTWGEGDATVIMAGKAPPAGAALANGYMANALDFDDGGKYTRGHPGAQIIPTVLAIGEQNGCSGEKILTAIAAGYETAHRVGRCWFKQFEEFRSCGSWGSIASAAAAATLLEIEKQEIRQAVAISDYNSPYLPMMRAIETPSMVKHGTGWGAMTGIISAVWAANGFTGPDTAFDTKACEPWFEDLGTHFIMAEENAVEFKEIPSCSWGHPAIKATINLVETHDLTKDEIERVEVRGFSEMAALFQDFPSSVEEAQWSVKWPLAVALVDGHVHVDGMSRERFNDQEVKAMARKIEIIKSEQLDQLNKSLSEEVGETSAWPTRVIIEARGGEIYDSGTVTSEPAKAASLKKLEKKFDHLVEPYLGARERRKALELVENFDSIREVSELTGLLLDEDAGNE